MSLRILVGFKRIPTRIQRLGTHTRIRTRGCAASDELDAKLKELESEGSKIDPYWIPHLKRVELSSAQKLILNLNKASPLGYVKPLQPIKSPLVLEIEQWKEEHPDKVILTRCGDFYECYGIDAIMLIAFAGLNAMR
jgi:hypothetical protein